MLVVYKVDICNNNVQIGRPDLIDREIDRQIDKQDRPTNGLRDKTDLQTRLTDGPDRQT